MPPSSTSLYNPRTYSKKGISKRKALERDEPATTDSHDQPTQSKKRRRVSPDIIEKELGGNDYDHHPEASRSKEENQIKSRKTNDKRKRSPTRSATHKPLSVAHDLSQLFDKALSPIPSLTNTPHKLSKRMLARSKTDTAIQKQPTEPLERTPSLPNFPVTPSKSPPVANIFEPLAEESLESSLPSLTTSKATRTYAGASRSFIVAMPASSSTSRALLASSSNVEGGEHIPEEEEDEIRESYADLRSRWGVDNSEDDPYPSPLSPKGSPISRSNPGSPGSRKHGKSSKVSSRFKALPILPPAAPLPNGMMNPLKSITELRSKGESRRFLDEVGYLFEGMDMKNGKGNLALRRASAMEITTKLCDTDFARKAKRADFLTRTWSVFCDAGAGRGDDIILDTLLCFFSVLVARDASSLVDLAQRTFEAVSEASPATQSSQQKLETAFPARTPIESQSVVDVLSALLFSRKDPLQLIGHTLSKRENGSSDRDAEFRSLGVGKKERIMLSTIHTTIGKSRVFLPFTAITTPLLVARTLHGLPPSLLHPRHFPIFLHSLKLDIEPFGTSVFGNHSENELPFLESVHLHLCLIDTFLLGQWGANSTEAKDEEHADAKTCDFDNTQALEAAKSEWLAESLVGLGTRMEARLFRHSVASHSPEIGSVALKCLETSLRVLVSLTHADEEWCQAVLDEENALPWIIRIISEVLRDAGAKTSGKIKQENVDTKARIKSEPTSDTDDDILELDDDGSVVEVSEVKDIAAQTLDRLCLALGLLTNLVQMVENTKSLLQEIRISHSCTMKKRACLHVCTCPNSLSALEVLVKLYLHYLPTLRPAESECSKSRQSPDLVDENAEAEASFLCGHLAVLFGLLMRSCPENEASILEAIPDPPLSPAKNKTARFGKMSVLVEQAKEFALFYDNVGGGGNTRGADGQVARDVVASLERLRDR
ncbi:hypothetical protein BDN72DRAFT_837394 [Pluteus cervinus]|uniref:Uncharacterized protein n=1 Tax=Pluteus cervinus TaxID=181527 RepID=A0ACD3B136_9AGAR|nr:hypothetical protein BDN72DRAFT_837394 [Pluteus cervinus]